MTKTQHSGYDAMKPSIYHTVSSQLLFFTMCSTSVQAGTFTDAPGSMQGDIAIQHMTSTITDSLYERDTLVGGRKQVYSDTALRIKLGLIDAVSVEAILPYGTDRISFTNAYQMKYDPLTETGSYLDTPTIEDLSRSGTGFEGTQVGLYFYPFHTKIHSNRGDVGNWQMGIVYRARDKSNFFSPNAEGNRGSGIGAQGFGLHTAFSKKNKGVEPYLSIKAIRSSSWEGEIRDDAGTLYEDSATFEPNHTVNVRGGTEIYLYDDVPLASYVTLDLFGEYNYASFQSIPSGTFLPTVLDSTRDSIISQTELVSIQGGIGTNVQISSIYSFRFSGQAGLVSPQRIEHIYGISTLGSFQWGVLGELRLRYRTTSS